MNKQQLRAGLAGVAGLCLLAPSANADLSDLVYQFPTAEAYSVRWDSVQNFSVNREHITAVNPLTTVKENNVTVGAGLIKLSPILANNTLGKQFTTVCLDVGNYLVDANNQPQTKLYSKVTGAGLTGINPEWGNQPSSENAALAIKKAASIAKYFNDTYVKNNTAQADHWQALQLVVWEALYDTPQGLNLAKETPEKRFSVNTTLSTTERQVADALIAYGNSAVLPANLEYSILVPVKKSETDGFYYAVNNQELMFDFGTITVVPEPTTYLAGALLLVPFGVSTLRLLRRKPAVEA